MTDSVVLGGITWHTARFTSIGEPYSMVLEWCAERFGPSHSWPIGFHDPAEKLTWGHDGGNFYFRDPADRTLFLLRWS